MLPNNSSSTVHTFFEITLNVGFKFKLISQHLAYVIDINNERAVVIVLSNLLGRYKYKFKGFHRKFNSIALLKNKGYLTTIVHF